MCQHVGSATLSKRNGHLHAARYDSDHLAPVERRHDSFSKKERKVAMNTIRGTDTRNKEVLERFFRVQGNNVDACWSGQSSMAELKGSASVLSARWNVPTSRSATEKMEIHAPSTKTTAVRFNSISESPGPTK